MKRIKSLILALAATTVMLWGQTEVSTPIVPSWERASEGATVISLSLQQAKDTAIRYNRQLQNASYDVKIAQAQRWQTIASMLPQVTAGYDYQNMMGFKMEMRIPNGKSHDGRRYGKRYRAGKPTQRHFQHLGRNADKRTTDSRGDDKQNSRRYGRYQPTADRTNYNLDSNTALYIYPRQ